MSHRSGLCRESPVGNYFDPDEPSLAKTVQSLNKTELVYEPETKTKYSNVGVTVGRLRAGRDAETAVRQYLYQTLLDPLEMKHSRFEKDPELLKELAKAKMWTYHGREFDAPTFELGTAPAGCMYTTVDDLGRFLSVLFARGKGPNGAILKPETLESMWKPQFVKPGREDGFRPRLQRQRIRGPAPRRPRRRHLWLLDRSVGAARRQARRRRRVVAGLLQRRDDAHRRRSAAAPARRQAEEAAAEDRRDDEAETGAGARNWPAATRRKTRSSTLPNSTAICTCCRRRGGFRQELRALGDDLIVDDRLAYGQRIQVKDGKLHVGADVYERVPTTKPAPMPAKWAGLIGEYGWDHNTLYIFEKDGQLYSLIEWFFVYPLKEESENVFAFPDFGLYLGEKLVFTRDKNGRATQVEAANVVFERRKIDGENGETFTIKPQRPVEELRKEALAAKPPVEKGDFRDPQSRRSDETRRHDQARHPLRDDEQLPQTPFYTSAKAFMQKPAAEALVRVHKKLHEQGYGLMVFDAYRPWAVTKMFWDATPEKQRIFVADPSKGSRHNRGCAVDLTLYDLKTGKPVEMVGGYDEMSDRSYPEYLGGTSLQRWHRELLRHAMESEGFTVYEAEWWHFDYKDWRQVRDSEQDV